MKESDTHGHFVDNGETAEVVELYKFFVLKCGILLLF